MPLGLKTHRRAPPGRERLRARLESVELSALAQVEDGRAIAQLRGS